MRYFLLFLVLIPVLCFSQTKTSEVVIPPSKDSIRIRFTTNTVTTTEYKIDYLPTSGGNRAPIASAGNDVAVTLPTNTVTLSAIASTDADGSIASYSWTKASGGTATLNQANTALNVSGLVQGVYVFRVTVVDNGGLSDYDEVTVTVNPAPSTGTRQNILFESLFNGSNPFPSSALYKQACCSHSATQSKMIVKEGDGSFRADSRSSDPSVSGGYRPEFIPLKNSSSQVDRLADAWYGYSVYMEDWKACSSCGEHIMQWHPDNGTGSAVLAVYTDKNTFHIRLNPEGDATAFTVKDGMQIKPNKWYDFVWHVIWSSDKSKGRIEVWIDGEKYADYTGSTLTRGGLPYFKIGINRWNMRENRVLYIDAVRIGNGSATYKDVAP